MDHVATPIGLPDIDTGEVLRRFIHRSVREHLVAEHVACLSVNEAAEALLPHIWYDLDWEYSAPAALAMHPQRDQLLRHLICRAAGSDQMPGDLSVIDGGWQFRGLLARAAAESSEADWPPKAGEIISQARVDLARSGHASNLGGAIYWEASNRLVREALLGLLTRTPDNSMFPGHRWPLVEPVVQLASTAEDKRQARDALLTLLARETIGGVAAARLADGVARLDPTAKDKRQARDALLTLLAHVPEGSVARRLADGVAQLDPTAKDKRQARDALLAREDESRADAGLEGITEGGKRSGRARLLAVLAREEQALKAIGREERDPQDEIMTAVGFMGALTTLNPTIQDLSSAGAWAAPPIPHLLASVRQNSTLADWLAVLPWLASLYLPSGPFYPA